MKRFFLSVALSLLALNLGDTAAAKIGAKLNFIFILVNDLGWKEMGCQGSKLYNLRDDLGEQNDLASKLPDQAKALREKLQAWCGEVGAQLPTLNPAADPTRDERRDAK